MAKSPPVHGSSAGIAMPSPPSERAIASRTSARKGTCRATSSMRSTAGVLAPCMAGASILPRRVSFPLRDAAAFFLLAFPALFAIVNPLGGAFIFLSATRRLEADMRERLARWVAIHSLVLLFGSFFVGGYVLSFFGISMPVLRVAGGIVIAMTAWRLLNAQEGESEGHSVRIADPREASRAAFFPLTMPITVGPGSISVAVALGTNRPQGEGPLGFALGAALTTILLALVIYVGYRFSDRVSRVIGPTGSAVFVRIAAFLLFCIGIQVLWTGISELLGEVRAR